MAEQISTIPKGWKMTTLGEVAEKIVDNRGKTPPIANSGFELLEVNAISENQRTPEYSKVTKFVEEETFNNWFRTGNISKNDILIPTVGTIGNVSFSKLSRGAIAQNLIAFRTDRNKAEPLLVYYLLKTPYYKNQLLKLDIGGVQPSIKVPHLLGLEINLPPLPEQHVIAAVLSSLDDKIELLREQNKTLEATAQAIFKEWFVNFNFPGATGKMIDSVLGEIPSEWRVGKLTEIFDFMEGPGIRNWQYTESGRRFMNIRLIQDGDIDIKNANFISLEEAEGVYKHFNLQEKDMVVSTSGTLGRAAIVRKEHLPLMLNTSVIRFRPIDKLSYGFMYQFLNSPFFQNELLSMASGSVQLNFGPVHLKQIEMVIPDEKRLKVYAMVANPLYTKIANNLSQIQILSVLRDALLPKLMKGEVRVKGFEN